MDSDNEESSSNSCELCELSGQLKAPDGGEDPIEKLLRLVGVFFLPWGNTEEPVKCESLTHQELWDKLQKFLEADWSSVNSTFTHLSSKLDKAEEKVGDATQVTLASMAGLEKDSPVGYHPTSQVQSQPKTT